MQIVTENMNFIVVIKKAFKIVGYFSGHSVLCRKIVTMVGTLLDSYRLWLIKEVPSL